MVVVFVVRISEHTETDQSTHTVTLIIRGDSFVMGRSFLISYSLFLTSYLSLFLIFHFLLNTMTLIICGDSFVMGRSSQDKENVGRTLKNSSTKRIKFRPFVEISVEICLTVCSSLKFQRFFIKFGRCYNYKACVGKKRCCVVT